MNPDKQKLLILGAGPFAEDVADMAETCGIEVIGFVINVGRENCRKTLFDKPIFWIDEIAEFVGRCSVICAIGTTFRDGFIKQVTKLGFTFTTLIHPSARVSARSNIQQGVIIRAGSIIASCVTIGKHVLINRGCLIGHHVQIGNYSTVSPGVNLGGNSRISEKAYLGMGSIVRDKCSVGQQSVVGAGAVVVENIPAHVMAIGLPARIVQENIEGVLTNQNANEYRHDNGTDADLRKGIQKTPSKTNFSPGVFLID